MRREFRESLHFAQLAHLDGGDAAGPQKAGRDGDGLLGPSSIATIEVRQLREMQGLPELPTHR